ncbi:MAG: hypothetical protein V4509_02005 [Patescibacteria group bacterium]
MWIPLKKYCEQYPWPSLSTLRWIIWRTEAGLEKQAPFVTRFGKRVLIDADIFQAWLTTKEAHDVKEKMILDDRKKKADKKVKQ